MAFKEFLFNHFPHRWLNGKKEGTKRFFTGLGSVFDWVERYVQIPVLNNSVRSAVEALPELENEYGIVIDPSADIELRRAKIIMKKRMQDCPITKSDLHSILGAVGIYVHIVNKYNASVIIFTVLANCYSLSVKEILNILYNNIRAHVGIELEIPLLLTVDAFIGLHISTQIEYNLNFKSYDSEYNIENKAYIGSRIMTNNEYEIDFKR